MITSGDTHYSCGSEAWAVRACVRSKDNLWSRCPVSLWFWALEAAHGLCCAAVTLSHAASPWL